MDKLERRTQKAIIEMIKDKVKEVRRQTLNPQKAIMEMIKDKVKEVRR